VRYYLFKPDIDTFDALLLADSSDWDRFSDFNGRSQLTGWVPVGVTIYRVGKSGDFPYLAPGIPVFSQRAWDALRPLIDPYVEALPLQQGRTTYYAINVTRVLDCLDQERSGVEWLEPGLILDVDHYVLKPGCLHGEPIFKVKGMEKKDVLVSSEFKTWMERARLKGAQFVPITVEEEPNDGE
jgi:hypothetical protein